MTRDELAAKLNGREIGVEIDPAESLEARKAGLIVIYGSSDDLCELRGAIDDELDAYQGLALRMTVEGKLLPTEIDRDHVEILEKYHVLDSVKVAIASARQIAALWCATPDSPSWTYETDVPHSTFDIIEGADGVYCRGIVIDLKEL